MMTKAETTTSLVCRTTKALNLPSTFGSSATSVIYNRFLLKDKKTECFEKNNHVYNKFEKMGIEVTTF